MILDTISGVTMAEALRRLALLCERATGADRSLDASIALLVFPGLVELRPLKIGIWHHPDGSRVRALRYTADERAALSLLAPGQWHEADERDPACHRIFDPGGGDYAGRQDRPALAIAAAALRARAAWIENERRAHAGAIVEVGRI